MIRDEFGLPVKASSVTIITRDESGLPVRSLQRTISAGVPIEKRAKATRLVSTGQTGSSQQITAIARDDSGLPRRLTVSARELEALNHTTKGRRPLPSADGVDRNEKLSTIMELVKMKSTYDRVENSGDTDSGRAPPPPPPLLPNHPSSVDHRQERSSGLSRVLRSADQHFAEQGRGESVVSVDPEDHYAVTKFYARNYVFGYPHSNGTISSNYIRFVGQQHPLLSLCFVKPQNPFNRRSRATVFVCVLAFAFFVNVALLDNFYYSKLEVCENGCNEVDGVCVGGENDGMKHSTYESNCQYYSPWVLALMCGTIIVPYNSLLIYLSSCSCLHGKAFFHFHFVGRSCKRLLEYAGGKLMVLVIVSSLAMVGWALYRCHIVDDNFNVILTLLQAKLWSFAEWFVWTAPYFAFRYPVDRKRFYDRLRRKQGVDAESGKGIGQRADSESMSLDRENSQSSLVSDR